MFGNMIIVNNFVNCDTDSNEGMFKQSQPQQTNIIGEQQNDENKKKHEYKSDTMISLPQNQQIKIHSINKCHCYHNNKTPPIPPLLNTENLLCILKTGSPSSSIQQSH